MRSLIFTAALLIISITATAAEESAQMRQFVDWDVNHNREQGVKVPTDVKPVEYLEIPLNDPKMIEHQDYMQWIRNEKGTGPHAIIVDMAEYLPPEVRNVVLVEKYGVQHVRYFISPTDTKFGKEVKTYLEKRGVLHRHYTANGEHKSEFLVRPTASRSMIVIDPRNGYSFSIKPSTSKSTQRHYNDPNPTHWAFLNRRLSDYYYQYRSALKHLDIAWEAGMVGFPNINDPNSASLNMQAQSIRLMDNVARGETYQMSGFVLTDSPQEFARIAQLAGVPESEFRLQAQMIKGKGVAELGAILGWTVTSNHSQNFRWELDKNYRLTGRIIFLDLTDGHPFAAIFGMNQQLKLLTDWDFLTKNEERGNTTNRTRTTKINSFWRDSQVPAAELEAYYQGVQERIAELVAEPALTRSGKDFQLTFKEEIAPQMRWTAGCMALPQP